MGRTQIRLLSARLQLTLSQRMYETARKLVFNWPASYKLDLRVRRSDGEHRWHPASNITGAGAYRNGQEWSESRSRAARLLLEALEKWAPMCGPPRDG